MRTAGFVIPSWDDLITEGPNQGSVEEENTSQPRFGRQKDVALVVHETFLEGELHPLLGAGGSSPAISVWPPRVRPFHQFAHAPGNHFRTPTLEVAPSLPFAPCYSPLCTLVPVWPCTRLPWPPPVCELEGGNLGLPWLPDGVRNGTVFREAGARVRTNVMVRDLDLGAFNHLDGRRLAIIADGLHFWRGAKLAIHTTLVSPTRANGTFQAPCSTLGCVALEEARKTKERKYPELAGNGGRARLVGRGRSGRGRFSAEAAKFLRGFVSAKVRGVPDVLKGKAAAAWSRRWRSMLGCVVGRVPPGTDGEVTLLSDVLGADRHR